MTHPLTGASLLAAATLLIPSAGHAQDAPTASVPAASAPGSKSASLAPVTVTGRRGTAAEDYRVDSVDSLGPLGATKIIDAPYSIGVLSQDLIVNSQAKSFKEVSKYLPLVSYQEQQGPQILRPQTRGMQGGNSSDVRYHQAHPTDHAARRYGCCRDQGRAHDHDALESFRSHAQRTRFIVGHCEQVEPPPHGRQAGDAENPTDALSLRTIAMLASQGVTMIMTTHDPNHALQFSNGRVALMRPGGLVAIGPADEVITEANLSKTYGIDVAVYSVNGREGGSARRVCSARLT